MTAPLSSQIETAHDDMIHDAQLDYYGKRLATCSSDRTVKVFDVVDGQAQTGAKGVTLKGHSGPVWQVAWAHPKYGHIIASCSYDGKVFIWKEDVQSSQGGARGAAPAVGWTKVKEHSLHTASVNSVSWAPHELGAIVACASSDGKISVLTFRNDNTWHADIFTAHSIGANAVSWMPAVVPGSLIAPPPPPTQSQSQSQPGPGAGYGLVKRFASAGCDNLVKVWGYNEQSATYNLLHTLAHHSDWVRDVAFAPNIGLPRTYLASCGQDRQVVVWTCDSIGASGSEGEGRESWGKCVLDGGADGSKFPDTVWRVSWSLSGNILAVSCGDGKVTLWKESITGDVGKDGGKWECVSEMSS